MKKMKKLTFLPLLILALAACNKKEVLQLDFDVKPEKASYKVGETVNFQISGNPDQVLFYSGEEGHKYIYKDRTQAQSDNITLEFATNRRYGLDAQQPNSFRLLASQTFNGKYDAANVNPADWVDITGAFTLSGIQSTDAAYVSSGVVNLTALTAQGFTLDKSKPVYFAFKYTGVTGSTQPRWWVNKFDLKTTTTDGQVLPVASISSATWTPVKVLTTSPVNWTFGSDLILKFQGGGATIGSNQVWAISGGLSLTKVKPDAGVALKNMSTRMDNYTYRYTAAGNYTVTFVASNVNVYGESKSIKEVQVVVTP
jgi:hypothetical protein